MKKIVLTLLAVALCLTICLCFVACGDTEDSDTTTSPTSGTQDKPQHDSNTGAGYESVDKTPSTGLEFKESKDGTYYLLSGLGTCTDRDIVVPDTYKKKPVKEVSPQFFINTLLHGCGEIDSFTVLDNMVSVEELYLIGESIELNLGKGVEKLPRNFNYTDVNISLENPYFKREKSSILSKDGKRLVAVFAVECEYEVPKGVEVISSEALLGITSMGILRLTLPTSLKTLETDVLQDTTALISLAKNAGVAEIYNLSPVELNKGGYEYIGLARNAFVIHNSLEAKSRLERTEDGFWFYRDSESACLLAYDGEKTEQLVLPADYNGDSYSIRPFGSFGNFERVVISKGVSHIPEGALCYMTAQSYEVEGDNGHYESVNGAVYTEDMTCIVKVPAKEGFDLTIGESVTHIYKQAFSENALMGTLTVPYHLMTQVCDAMCLKLVIMGGEHLTEEMMQGIRCNSIVVPKSVTKIDSKALSSVSDEVHIGHISTWLSIDFEQKADNPLYNRAKLFVDGALVEGIIIPDGTERISSYAFAHYRYLKYVYIPSSVTEIGEEAFTLWMLYTDGTTNVSTSVDAYAFCEAKSISVGWEWEYPSDRMIWDCDDCGLTDDGIWWISSNEAPNEAVIIKYVGEAEEITIPASINGHAVVSIGANAFRKSEKLKRVVIAKGVKRIEDFAFISCEAIESVYIPASVEYVGIACFEHSYGVSFFCEAESQPQGWSEYWNIGSFPVQWGCDN